VSACVPFQPEVRRCDAGGLDIKFHACPLKEAWQAAGFAPEKIATLCRIAGVVDDGTFAAAGFSFSAETWRPGEEGCCFLHIRPG
jgi:L-2-amino-thiazoline-4-carboxylic acid hydrolase